MMQIMVIGSGKLGRYPGTDYQPSKSSSPGDSQQLASFRFQLLCGKYFNDLDAYFIGFKNFHLINIMIYRFAE